MVNSHTKQRWEVEPPRWQPIQPPRRGEDRTAFHIHMLLPGLSTAFHAATLRRCRSSISNYRRQASVAAESDPVIRQGVNDAVSSLCPEHGLQMARIRGDAQLPHWARLAILDYRKRGFRLHQIAAAFRCSPGTVANVLRGKGRSYGVFSGERCLTACQRKPPNRWSSKKPENSDATV